MFENEEILEKEKKDEEKEEDVLDYFFFLFENEEGRFWRRKIRTKVESVLDCRGSCFIYILLN